MTPELRRYFDAQQKDLEKFNDEQRQKNRPQMSSLTQWLIRQVRLKKQTQFALQILELQLSNSELYKKSNLIDYLHICIDSSPIKTGSPQLYDLLMLHVSNQRQLSLHLNAMGFSGRLKFYEELYPCKDADRADYKMRQNLAINYLKYSLAQARTVDTINYFVSKMIEYFAKYPLSIPELREVVIPLLKHDHLRGDLVPLMVKLHEGVLLSMPKPVEKRAQVVENINYVLMQLGIDYKQGFEFTTKTPRSIKKHAYANWWLYAVSAECAHPELMVSYMLDRLTEMPSQLNEVIGGKHLLHHWLEAGAVDAIVEILKRSRKYQQHLKSAHSEYGFDFELKQVMQLEALLEISAESSPHLAKSYGKIFECLALFFHNDDDIFEIDSVEESPVRDHRDSDDEGQDVSVDSPRKSSIHRSGNTAASPGGRKSSARRSRESQSSCYLRFNSNRRRSYVGKRPSSSTQDMPSSRTKLVFTQSEKQGSGCKRGVQSMPRGSSISQPNLKRKRESVSSLPQGGQSKPKTANVIQGVVAQPIGEAGPNAQGSKTHPRHKASVKRGRAMSGFIVQDEGERQSKKAKKASPQFSDAIREGWTPVIDKKAVVFFRGVHGENIVEDTVLKAQCDRRSSIDSSAGIAKLTRLPMPDKMRFQQVYTNTADKFDASIKSSGICGVKLPGHPFVSSSLDVEPAIQYALGKKWSGKMGMASRLDVRYNIDGTVSHQSIGRLYLIIAAVDGLSEQHAWHHVLAMYAQGAAIDYRIVGEKEVAHIQKIQQQHVALDLAVTLPNFSVEKMPEAYKDLYGLTQENYETLRQKCSVLDEPQEFLDDIYTLVKQSLMARVNRLVDQLVKFRVYPSLLSTTLTPEVNWEDDVSFCSLPLARMLHFAHLSRSHIDVIRLHSQPLDQYVVKYLSVFISQKLSSDFIQFLVHLRTVIQSSKMHQYIRLHWPFIVPVSEQLAKNDELALQAHEYILSLYKQLSTEQETIAVDAIRNNSFQYLDQAQLSALSLYIEKRLSNLFISGREQESLRILQRQLQKQFSGGELVSPKAVSGSIEVPDKTSLILASKHMVDLSSIKITGEVQSSLPIKVFFAERDCRYELLIDAIKASNLQFITDYLAHLRARAQELLQGGMKEKKVVKTLSPYLVGDIVTKLSDFNKVTPLHIAAGWRKEGAKLDLCLDSVLQQLMLFRLFNKQQFSLSAKLPNQQRLLHLLAIQGSEDCIKYILNRHAHLNASYQDHMGNTAIHYAAMHGHLLAVICLSKVSDFAILNKDLKTPLDLARLHQFKTIVDYLAPLQHFSERLQLALKASSGIASSIKEFDTASLEDSIYQIYRKKEEDQIQACANYCMSRRAPMPSMLRGGIFERNIPFLACQGNKPKLAKVLMKIGVDMNATPHRYYTDQRRQRLPLFTAVKRGFYKVVKIILHYDPMLLLAVSKEYKETCQDNFSADILSHIRTIKSSDIRRKMETICTNTYVQSREYYQEQKCPKSVLDLFEQIGV